MAARHYRVALEGWITHGFHVEIFNELGGSFYRGEFAVEVIFQHSGLCCSESFIKSRVYYSRLLSKYQREEPKLLL